MDFSKIPTVAKACAAFVALLIPFLTAVGILLTHVGAGNPQVEDFVNVGVAFSALVGGTKLVYQVRNRPAVK